MKIQKKQVILQIKRIIIVVLFSAGLIGMLTGLSYVFRPKDNTKEAGMQEYQANGVFGEPENTIDVLFLGDSEVFAAYSPLQIWKEYGITSYVCSTPKQTLSTSQSFLEKVMENQDIKVVVLETNSIYRRTPITHIAERFFETMALTFTYHDRWKTMSFSEIGQEPEYNYTDKYKGYRYVTEAKPALVQNYMSYSDGSKMIPPMNRLYIDSILRICKEKDIQLILVSTPSTVNWDYEKHNGVKKLADSNDLLYVDLNLKMDELKINWKTDTRDNGDHMNNKGAKKVTGYIGKYLDENCTLTDHRDDKKYSSWDDALKKYIKDTEKKKKKK